jgi:hypothetical protein
MEKKKKRNENTHPFNLARIIITSNHLAETDIPAETILFVFIRVQSFSYISPYPYPSAMDPIRLVHSQPSAIAVPLHRHTWAFQLMRIGWCPVRRKRVSVLAPASQMGMRTVGHAS